MIFTVDFRVFFESFQSTLAAKDTVNRFFNQMAFTVRVNLRVLIITNRNVEYLKRRYVKASFVGRVRFMNAIDTDAV